MANYQCAVRSNYFHVKDPELFRQFMARVYGANGTVELWEEKDANGQTVFAFGSYGGISGLRDAAEDSRKRLMKRLTTNLSSGSSRISRRMMP